MKYISISLLFSLLHVFAFIMADEEVADGDKDTANTTDELMYYNPAFDPENPPEPLYSKSGVRLVTINELKAHGVDGQLRPLWLGILGKVFDVDRAYDTHYGPKGGYSFFTGRDGSNAFVTGEFDDKGLIDDILLLTPQQVDEVEGWVRFYEKDYTYVGKLIGRYYDQTGNPTKYWYKYQRKLQEAAKLKVEKAAEEHQFPPCNSRFVQGEGGTVYCSKKSGGIERDWEGLPRRYFAPTSKEWRCACVNEPELDNPRVRLYPDCGPEDKICKIDKEKLNKQEL